MQGKRETMEDAHCVILEMEKHPGWGLFAVFDGHEGSDTSAYCASHLWKKLDSCEEFTSEAIVKTFMDFDDELGDRTSGSTACLLLVDHKKKENGYHLIVVNLGDSRSFLANYNTTDFKCLTIDHKPSLPEEMARIEASGASVYRNRVNSSLAVSRAFGDSPYKSQPELPKDKQRVISVPDVSHVYLQPDEFLFICCDGIFDSQAFSNEETIEFLRKDIKDTRDTAEILSKLVTSVLNKGSKDNISAMLIELRDGSDYNIENEFILGTFYPRGNDSYLMGYRLDCETHGLIWDQIVATLPKSSTSPADENDAISSIRSSPSLVIDKNLTAAKVAAKPGMSKSSRTLAVSPTTLAKLDMTPDRKIEEKEKASEKKDNHTIEKKDNHHHKEVTIASSEKLTSSTTAAGSDKEKEKKNGSMTSPEAEKKERGFRLKIGRAKTSRDKPGSTKAKVVTSTSKTTREKKQEK
jgi:serine/threonine protein phosphatase PrpC